MDIIIALVFISLTLVIAGLVFFFSRLVEGDFEHGERLSLLPLEDDTVLLFGLRGHLFRSEDAGEIWEKIETGTVAILNSGVRLEDGTIVVAGLSGAVLMSTDGGNTFELYQQANRRGISAVVDVGNGSLLLVGEFGVKTVTLDQLIAGES